MNFEVTPRSRAEINALAFHLRKAFKMDKEFCFPIVEFLEQGMNLLFGEFNYEYCPESEMKGVEGFTIPEKNLIIINENVMIGATQDDGRARFTIAHEIGHYFLHRYEKTGFARFLNNNLPAYRSSEWQADAFAGELLMPRHLITDLSPEEIREKCQVSKAAAECQWRKYRQYKQIA